MGVQAVSVSSDCRTRPSSGCISRFCRPYLVCSRVWYAIRSRIQVEPRDTGAIHTIGPALLQTNWQVYVFCHW